MVENLDQDVLIQLLTEMVSCSPPEWTKGSMTIECTDGEYMSYSITNDEEPGTAIISDELPGMIDALYFAGRQSGTTWSKLIATFERNGDNVRFNLTVTPINPALLPPLKTAKPFWKIW